MEDSIIMSFAHCNSSITWVASSNTNVCLNINRSSHTTADTACLQSISYVLSSGAATISLSSTLWGSHVITWQIPLIKVSYHTTLYRGTWPPKLLFKGIPTLLQLRICCMSDNYCRSMHLEGDIPHGNCCHIGSVPMSIAPPGRLASVICLSSHARTHAPAPPLFMLGFVGLCSGSNCALCLFLGRHEQMFLNPRQKTMTDKRYNSTQV